MAKLTLRATLRATVTIGAISPTRRPVQPHRTIRQYRSWVRKIPTRRLPRAKKARLRRLPGPGSPRTYQPTHRPMSRRRMAGHDAA